MEKITEYLSVNRYRKNGKNIAGQISVEKIFFLHRILRFKAFVKKIVTAVKRT